MRALFTLILCLSLSFRLSAQCELIDGNGVMNANPMWIGCTGMDYTLFIQSNTTFGNYTIDWGDGSPVTTGTGLVPPAFVSHVYAATVANYTVTFTDTALGCVITGTVVLEEPVNASIQIPIGGVTQICAPNDIQFVNSSTDVSNNTTFTWDFGDGTPPLVFGDTNQGDTVTHTYAQGTVNCVTAVTLTAENFCSFGNPTVATFNPIQVYDLDDAQITASNVLLCYPDTVVHFDNTTNRNCVPEGNVAQRYEYWNFGNYWGTGQDSIIDWQPFLPPARPGYDIAFPGIGTYTVMMIDSNMCGQDTAFITIDIVPPPTAGITANRDTICAGENVTFFNGSGGGANAYQWNFDQGAGFQGLGGGNKTRTYNTAGSYTITIIATIAGGTANCVDTATVDLEVLPSPNAQITINNNNGCDSMDVVFTDASTGSPMTWAWTFGNGNTDTTQTPPTQSYTAPGNYTATLMVTGSNGCTDTDNQNLTVYQSPVPAFTPLNVCQGAVSTFLDQSVTAAGDPAVSWSWDFGDGGMSNQQNPQYTYAANGTFNVIFQVNTANCFGLDTIPLSVEPKPTAAFSLDTMSGCSPLIVQFTNSSAGATNYTWDFGDGTTSNAANPQHTFTNNSGSDTTYFISLISATAFGCSDTATDSVTILSNPGASFTASSTLGCGPMLVNFSNSSVGVSTYSWDFGDSTGSNLANPSHVYTNTTLFNTVFTPTLTVTGSNGCTDTASQSILVYPTPIFDFSTIPDSGCSPLPVSFISSTSTVAVSFFWDFGDGNTGTGLNPTNLYVNNTTNDQIFNVELVTVSSANCMDTTYSTVLVHPKPTAAFTGTPDTVCHPGAVTFTNTSTGAVSFLWNFDDGDTSDTIVSTFPHTFTNTGSAPVTRDVSLIVETTAGCFDTANQDIVVNPLIDALFTSDTVGCHPFTVSFNDLSTGVDNYFWDFGDGDTSTQAAPTHLFSNTGTTDSTYTVKLVTTSQYGCSDSQMVNILVHPKPLASFTGVPDTVCHPGTVSFTNNSTVATIFNWDFDDGNFSTSGAATLNHTFQNTGNIPINRNVELLVTTTDGCLDTANQNVVVNPLIEADFSSDSVGCHPYVVNFTDLSIGADSFYWDFGDGDTSTLASPTHIFQNNGTTNVTYTVKLVTSSQYGCADSHFVNVLVYPKPVAAFTASDTIGCQPLAVNFIDNSVIADSYVWSFGDGNSDSTAGSVQNTYVNTSTTPSALNAVLFVETVNGCRDTANQGMLIYPEIIAAFTSDTMDCHPFPVTFTNNSSGANSYFWNFGDGDTSSLVFPNHVYTNLTTGDLIFPAQLIATSPWGCQDSTVQNITVHPKPTAAFVASDTVGCQPFGVAFNNNSQLAAGYVWAFGDGDTSTAGGAQVVHVYDNLSANPVTSNMVLIVESVDGCLDTADQNILTYPLVQAAFTHDTVGCSPLPVAFTNTSIGATTYAWNFGDNTNSTQTSPSHTYTNPSFVNVTYIPSLVATSQYMCSDTTSSSILVYPKPVAAFTTNDTIDCQPFGVTFTNSSIIADSYLWTFGDGDTSQSSAGTLQHTYTNLGANTLVNNMSLVVETVNGCSDTATQDIYVYPHIIADFGGDTVGCSPFNVTFTDLSTNAATYLWDFGDGSPISIQQNPNHTFTNILNTDTVFTVTMVAISADNCSDTTTLDILVHPKPLADYAINPTSVCDGLPVTFTNNSVLNATNFWDFGNNNIFDTINVAAFDSTFFNPGSTPIDIDITLIVQTVHGCLDTTQQTLEVFPRITADFTVADSACNPVDANFTNNSIGAVGYTWFFGDGSAPSNQQLPTHTFANNGINDTTYTVTLAVQSIHGCVDTAQQTITVFPQPIAGFNATPANQVFPSSTVTLTNTTNPGIWNYNWSFGDATTSTQQNPAPHVYTTWGMYNIQLVVSNANCTDTAIQQVQIDPPLPIAAFEGTGEGCKPHTVTFTNLSQYGVTYEWDFGDGGKSTLENPPPYTYFNAGTYTVSLRVVGPGGDVDIAVLTNTVTVHESAIAFFDLNPFNVVIPTQEVQFFNFSNFATSYLWDFGDGTTSTEPFPTHQYLEEGGYSITLIANNDFGCPDTFTHPNQVIAEAKGEVQFPNAFTPNAAGSNGGIYDANSIANEVFFPLHSGVLDYHLMIFNRWGELIFESKDINVGWDGYYRGKICQQDVYVWKVVAELSNGNVLVKAGDVTLLR